MAHKVLGIFWPQAVIIGGNGSAQTQKAGRRCNESCMAAPASVSRKPAASLLPLRATPGALLQRERDAENKQTPSRNNSTVTLPTPSIHANACSSSSLLSSLLTLSPSLARRICMTDVPERAFPRMSTSTVATDVQGSQRQHVT
jgi:hypothetical protein